MRDIIISIQPQWVEKILNGEKTVYIRKTKPNCNLPVKVYIYCTKKRNDPFYDLRYLYKNCLGNSLIGKVVAEFTLNKANIHSESETHKFYFITEKDLESAYLTNKEILNYGNGKTLYSWHISDLKIYDKPKELSEFGLTKAPQSWQYVKGGL